MRGDYNTTHVTFSFRKKSLHRQSVPFAIDGNGSIAAADDLVGVMVSYHTGEPVVFAPDPSLNTRAGTRIRGSRESIAGATREKKRKAPKRPLPNFPQPRQFDAPQLESRSHRTNAFSRDMMKERNGQSSFPENSHSSGSSVSSESKLSLRISRGGVSL